MKLDAGTRLGPYEVTSQIGAGGMGEVYRATDTSLKRAVAIKVVSAALALDQERITRLQREAQVLASLNHPNIAAVYGLEQSAGVTGLVMELVEGPTLADRIERGALPLPEVRAIGAQIADALEAAHQQGVIHRDLKPANIKNSASGVRIARADRSRPALLPSPPIVASGQNGRLSPDGKWISYQASLGNTPVAGVFFLRTIADVEMLKATFQPGKSLVVVGGGYIGLELAAVAAKQGLKVTVLEQAPRVMGRGVGPVKLG